MIEIISGKITTKIKCNKCGEIMPLVWAGTMKDLQKKELKHKIKTIICQHNCKKLKKITLIEEFK